jgi:hypothetical protein
MAEFNQLVALVDSLIDKKYERQEREVERAYKALETQDARNFQREMIELGQKHDLNKVVMAEQIKLGDEVKTEYQNTINEFETTVGTMTKKSSTFNNALKVINNAYEQPIDNQQQVIKLTQDKVEAYQNEQENIQSLMGGIVKEAKEYLFTNYSDYVDKETADKLLSPFEVEIILNKKEIILLKG